MEWPASPESAHRALSEVGQIGKWHPMENYDALSADERVRIHMRLFSPLFGVLEQQFLHLTHGNIEPVFLNSIKRRMADAGRLPGIRMWWERNRAIYSLEFQQYVDEIYLTERLESGAAVNDPNGDPSPSTKSLETDA